MARLTLEEFRLTRTPCADLRKHPIMGNSYPEDDFVEPIRGFLYADESCHIIEDTQRDGIKVYDLTICNETYDQPRTPEGLAELEEILYKDWYLTEIADPLPEGADDPDFFYWTVRVGVHKSWVSDGFDIEPSEAHERLRCIVPHCHGSEFSAEVLASPVAEMILREQGYEGEKLTEALKLRHEVPEGEEQP